MTGEHVDLLPLRDATLPVLAGRVAVPTYDRSSVSVGIVHFGVGGFHRAHQAMYTDDLLNDGLAGDWGICGVGLLPADRDMAEVMRAQDCLYTLVTRAPDGSTSARVIGSIVDYRYAPDDPAAVLDILTDEQVRVVTLTVTEAGYNIHRVTGEFVTDDPAVAADVAAPHAPRTVFGFVVEALARRRAVGLPPFTVVSCDNVQGNGHVAQRAFTAFARLRSAELADWIDAAVSFPNSMVDRITPATTDDDRRQVRDELGIDDGWPVVCEPFTQWVLQDVFPQGRPPWHQAGVQVVTDVEPYELMKLRLLNAGHQALGYAGYLAGYRYVHEAVTDPAFAALLREYMLAEAIPTLRPVPDVDLPAYVESLLERFGNPAIRDTLARLCVDSSERMPKFVLPVIAEQLTRGGPIDRAVAIVASWARYCEGTDEQGAPINLVDPAAEALTAAARRQRVDPLAFIRQSQIFGGLADHPRFVESYTRALDTLLEHGATCLVRAFTGERSVGQDVPGYPAPPAEGRPVT